MTTATPAPRWSARVDRTAWATLTATAAARGIDVEDLIAGELASLSPADVAPTELGETAFVKAHLPEPVRVEIRTVAYLAQVRIADVIAAIAGRVRVTDCVPA